jgi:hypothetical protein
MTASTCRTSFAISILLTQSSTVIMPRRPMIIFNETVIAGTVLFLILFLKSSTLSAAVEKFSSTAGGVLHHGPAILKFRSAVDWGRANRPDLPVRAVSRSPLAALELYFDGLPVDIADWCCESTSRVVSKSMGRPAYSRGPKMDRARCYPTMLACYRFRARRHVPGLTPTACLKIRVR